MNTLVELIVNQLISTKLIDKDEKENYLYAVQMLLLKFIGILTLGMIAIIFHKYIETLIFYIAFSSLRTYTNGYHAKTFSVCLVQSIILYFLVCAVFYSVLIEYIYLSYIITIISIILIYLLAPINSKSINFTEEEIAEHKTKIKQILVFDLLIGFTLINFKVSSELVVFFESAIIMVAVLILTGKYFVYKEDTQ